MEIRCPSRLLSPDAPPAGPEPISLDHWSCYLGDQAIVREAQCSHPDPGTGPLDCLFVLEEVQRQVLQWGHSSRFSRHHRAQWKLHFVHQHFWCTSQSKDVSEFCGGFFVFGICLLFHQHSNYQWLPALSISILLLMGLQAGDRFSQKGVSVKKWLSSD